MESKMTIKQALEEGFEWAGKDMQDYQCLVQISEMEESDFNHYDWVIFGKEARYLTVDPDWLRETVVDLVMDNGDIADDTDDIPDALKANVDWKGFSEKINEAMKVKWYRHPTEIKLIWA